MKTRMLLALIATALSLSAQTTAFGTKPAETIPVAPGVTTTPAAKPKAIEEEVDNSVVITPFRALPLPEPKANRTFQISKINKLGFTETTRELQRLFSAFTMQRIVDGSPNGSSKATGYLATINYTLIQDLGDNRFLAKAAWPAAGPNEALAAGADTMAVLLLEKPAKIGDSGKTTGMHVGTVAILFTANFPPIAGKRLTLRREAFVECSTIEDNPAALQKFIEEINAGADLSVTTSELTTCKRCSGLGFTRETQKGQLVDKRVPCTDCASSGKVLVPVEIKFVP